MEMLSQNPIGKIEIVPVRDAFPHEAHNFTRWLAENIDALCERLGFDLTVIQREQKVGEFNVDLLCQDEDGNRVIIENQLERTDHSHLGQVLTYLVNLDAKIAIWVTPASRIEHQRVIDWLNENTPADIAFYLVKVEAIKIGASPYAPLFSILTQPDEQIKEIGKEKQVIAEKELNEQHRKHMTFWEELLEKSKSRTHLAPRKSIHKAQWIGINAGRDRFNFYYYILKDRAVVDLYIDAGLEKTKIAYDQLISDKTNIENEFGAPLEWRYQDGRQTARIIYTLDSGNLRDESTWSTVQDEMIDAMIRLDKVFRPRIAKLNL